ncbi:MAG: hypothetical protein G01um101420_376 [Parcubacteria group bacterium Gr01-1014_20]|nr:MAG: hypothetical protein G01um101420_376 [Parcubacteria group bacterium Gr01-1014_20]
MFTTYYLATRTSGDLEIILRAMNGYFKPIELVLGVLSLSPLLAEIYYSMRIGSNWDNIKEELFFGLLGTVALVIFAVTPNPFTTYEGKLGLVIFGIHYGIKASIRLIKSYRETKRFSFSLNMLF